MGIRAHPDVLQGRTAVDLLVDLLVSRERVDGEDVRQVVEGAADAGDLARRAEGAQMALL
ncbi:hypothetical protein FOA52_005118 [Chlamydomonas sp. UWO 241]|nr:hypothetical protein FOA52_005118 [Chlamydomonas sp. UWO 241]